MNDRIAVGTPVTVSSNYSQHAGRNDLVVLSDEGTGYGVGPKGNDPDRPHDGELGWLYYSNTNSRVTPKKESKTVTKFSKGDKVEFIEFYMAGAITGTKATVVSSYGEFTEVLTEDGARYTPFSRRLKLVEEPALTLDGFTVGDKVRYSGSYWKNVEGIVSAVNGEYIDVRVIKLPDNVSPYSSLEVGKTMVETCGGMGICPQDLTKIEEPKPFTFKDIQQGDTIRRTATYEGATEVREGVVGSRGSYYWANEQGNYILAYDTDDEGYRGVTLELLNRPEPEPVKEPTLLENTKAGDKLVIEFKHGLTKVYTKGKAGSWSTLVLTGNGQAHNGFTWSSEALEREVERAAVKGHSLIPA